MLEAAAVLAPKLLLAKTSGLLLAGSAAMPNHELSPIDTQPVVSTNFVMAESDHASGVSSPDHAAFIWPERDGGDGRSWFEPLLKGVKIPPSETIALGESAAAAAEKGFAHLGQNIDTGCPTCLAGKDFSEPCPLDWHTGPDGTCTAPPGYAGFCDTSQSFIGASAERREEVELMCGVCWPCREVLA
eukprot:gnl/TRDRNA2_/TRDRNA2_198943_c0_seq1.p1 gnl/TRDRNA2_/TRDRNA2_198943_c0~~gnl/TRDRNA2_/TRDRNA2_198943_c0_seq1.p1  ORF type:complete len:187 (+),score=25.63 gnl/TRDRNA2_/TRDRNA2_198943_c0_seq1:81-641(+)